MNIHELPMDWGEFIEAILEIKLDINITVGQMDQLANDIVEAAAARGMDIKRSEVIKHLKAAFAETQIQQAVLDIKHAVLDIQSQVDINPRRLYPNLLVAEALTDEYQNRVRKNVRSFLKRRGSASTRKYLSELCSAYPEQRHVYEEVLRGLP